MGSTYNSPSFFEQRLDNKNSNSIPQGFALRPAVSLAPSLKEIATPDESA